MNANNPEYEKRISSQIAQYANPDGRLKLGLIYHYWINKHIRPRIAEVFGVNNAFFFLRQLHGGSLASARCASANRQPGCRRLRSRPEAVEG